MASENRPKGFRVKLLAWPKLALSVRNRQGLSTSLDDRVAPNRDDVPTLFGVQHPANQALRKAKMSRAVTPPPSMSASGAPVNHALKKSKMSCTVTPPV